MLWGWTRPQQQQSQHHLAPLLCIQVQRKRLLLLETTSSTAIPTTGASLTSGPVYTDAREALTEAPIRAAAPLKSPKCILLFKCQLFQFNYCCLGSTLEYSVCIHVL